MWWVIRWNCIYSAKTPRQKAHLYEKCPYIWRMSYSLDKISTYLVNAHLLGEISTYSTNVFVFDECLLTWWVAHLLSKTSFAQYRWKPTRWIAHLLNDSLTYSLNALVYDECLFTWRKCPLIWQKLNYLVKTPNYSRKANLFDESSLGEMPTYAMKAPRIWWKPTGENAYLLSKMPAYLAKCPTICMFGEAYGVSLLVLGEKDHLGAGLTNQMGSSGWSLPTCL